MHMHTQKICRHTHVRIYAYMHMHTMQIHSPYYVCAWIQNVTQHKIQIYRQHTQTHAHTNTNTHTQCTHRQRCARTHTHTLTCTTNLLACIAGPPSSSSQVTAFLGSLLLQWSPHNTSAECPHWHDEASEQTGSLVHPRHLLQCWCVTQRLVWSLLCVLASVG